MTQLTDGIREAILGNIGTVISGRIGITDAEILQKKFMPVFDAEDLTKLPNFQTITSVMINNVPSAAFSMSLVPSMGKSSPELRDALKKLSAAKYGRPRALVEKEIFERLGVGDAARKAKIDAVKKIQQERMMDRTPQPIIENNVKASGASSGSSFLDEWLAKRQQINSSKDGRTDNSGLNNSFDIDHRNPTNREELSIRKQDIPNIPDDNEVSISLR